VNASINSFHGVGVTSLRIRQRLVRRLWEAGIRNEQVLQAMLTIPRHLFVKEAFANYAYKNTALPIGFGQTISQPYIVARMTEILLAGRSLRKVLEVGTGSAYQTAVLSLLIEQVYSIERIGALLKQAQERLRTLGLNNVWLKHGDGNLGWPEHGPFDGILVTAAAAEIPTPLLEQLSFGGYLVMPVGTAHAQTLVKVERKASGFEERILGSVSFVPLLGGIF
jgi:protein-L-isoaspartate(D-aspartate) O-methyltransferase